LEEALDLSSDRILKGFSNMGKIKFRLNYNYLKIISHIRFY